MLQENGSSPTFRFAIIGSVVEAESVISRRYAMEFQNVTITCVMIIILYGFHDVHQMIKKQKLCHIFCANPNLQLLSYLWLHDVFLTGIRGL